MWPLYAAIVAVEINVRSDFHDFLPFLLMLLLLVVVVGTLTSFVNKCHAPEIDSRSNCSPGLIQSYVVVVVVVIDIEEAAKVVEVVFARKLL